MMDTVRNATSPYYASARAHFFLHGNGQTIQKFAADPAEWDPKHLLCQGHDKNGIPNGIVAPFPMIPVHSIVAMLDESVSPQ